MARLAKKSKIGPFKGSSTLVFLCVVGVMTFNVLPARADCPGPGCPAINNIFEFASDAGNLSTMVSAIDAAGLRETLESDSEFTIFAPTDEAFANLPSGTMEDLLKPENKDQLLAIISLHIIPGRVLISESPSNVVVSSVNGFDLDIQNGATPSINGVNISQTNTEVSNGLVQKIDAVLFKPM